MMESFRHLRHLHGMIELLLAASALALPPEKESERQTLLAALCPEEMTSEAAAGLACGPLPGTVDRFLKSLAGLVQPANGHNP